MAIDDIERFRERYAAAGQEALLAAELEALGTDYGANGYTTRAQAAEIGDSLDLGPGQLLLDVGAGCGWPGLYLALRHGCSVISLDPVSEGVGAAHRRAEADGVAARASAVIASAEAIPLASGSVHAIVQADVLC